MLNELGGERPNIKDLAITSRKRILERMAADISRTLCNATPKGLASDSNSQRAWPALQLGYHAAGSPNRAPHTGTTDRRRRFRVTFFSSTSIAGGKKIRRADLQGMRAPLAETYLASSFFTFAAANILA